MKPRIWIAGAVLLVLGVYLARLDSVAGQYVDDAVYVMGAKAIASGLGYHMISAPTPEMAAILPAFPPGFSVVLGFVFALVPAFPANVLALKLVSVAAMLGVGALSFLYYRDRSLPRSFALAVAIAVVITPAFVFLAASTVMSEPVFTLAELTAIVLIGRRRPMPGGVAAAVAALVRSAGLPILAAGAIWYWTRRDRRSAVTFLLTAGVLLLPWMIYARVYAAPIELRTAHGGAFVTSYAEQFWMTKAGETQSGRITPGDLPARIGASLVDIFGRDTGAIVLPVLYRSPIESGMETMSVGGRRSDFTQGSMGNTTGTMIVSALLSLLALAGFAQRWRRGASGAGVSDWFVPLALVPIAVFPHWAYRLVLPLTPFLYGYLIDGLQAITAAWTRVLRIALPCIIGLHVADHALYGLRIDESVWRADARERDGVIRWMQDTLTEPGAVASTNPPLIFLHTGRRGVVNEDARGRWEAWKKLGVRYVVDLMGSELPDPALGYRVLLTTPRSRFWVVEIASGSRLSS
ncbi:MAG TPA: glycosyltransferase 87 family protein [Vicinamibacterales bacterium]|nr:glycosyltransferase 87 family protein [Vicinamibacterales bacterium]